VAGDRLVEEYQKINAGRKAVLAAVGRAAAARQWNRWQSGGRWYLGKARREVAFSVGEELSDALRTLAPEQAIRQALAESPEFAEESVRELGQEGGSGNLPEKALSPDPPLEQPPLRELDEATMAKLDAFADRAIADYFHRKETIRDYRNRDIFDPAIDTWATMADWVQVAERRRWPDATAILILLDAGDPRGAEWAQRFVSRLEPHEEVDDAVVELAWRFRHEVPELARRWFSPEPSDQVPFAELRARLGDPVARWYLVSNEGFDLRDESTWTTQANPSVAGLDLPSGVREEICWRLLDWARTTWACSPVDEEPLRAALWLGLTEVADALEENPFLANGLLCHARREGMMDEPGILFGGNLLYVWSRLKATDLLGRIIASTVFGDVLELAKQANRDAAARDPKCAEMLGMTLQVLERWYQDLKTPLAIAWKRYRQQSTRP
jgi:hypothetical protein